MTEPFPFGSLDEPVADGSDEAASNRRNLLLLGAVGAVALAAGGFFLLSGGGDDAGTEAFVPSARPRAASPSTAPAAVALPVAANVSLGRNPFKALYVGPQGADGGGGGAQAPSASGAGTVPPLVSGPTTTTPATPPAAGPTTPIVVVANPPAGNGGSTTPSSGGSSDPAPAPAPAAPAQSTVALKGVQVTGGKPVGTFVYDGATVTGGVGDIMSGRLMVLSLQQDATGSWFANLQLGDGSPFEVHERQTVVVQ